MAALGGVVGADFTPLIDRLDVVAGRPAVVPVASGPPGRAFEAPTVRLSDGERVAASLYRFEVEMSRASEQDPIVRAWLAPAMRWQVRTAGEAARKESETAGWALLLDLPEGARGDTILIGETSTPVNWLEAPEGHGPLPLTEMPRVNDALGRWIDALLADPMERWRAGLLLDRLARDGRLHAAVEPHEPDEHPVMNSFARQEEDRWRAALHRLAAVDAQLCADVASALTDVIDFGAGLVAPAWTPTDSELVRFRSELLDPRMNGERLAHRARVWLGERSGLTTWVIDDAGAADARGAPIVSLGVAERRGRAEMAGLRLPGLGMQEEGRRTPLRPHGRIVLVRAIDAGPGPVEVDIVAGDRRARQLVLCNPVEVTPPGLVIGPLLRDWRMVDWDAGVPSPAMGDGATAAMLQRGVHRDAWELYIECRTPTAPTEQADPEFRDQVRVWLGPTIGPVATLRISDDGVMVDEQRPGDEPSRLSVQREADRWSVIVPIPKEAIGPDGVLRLAMQRVNGQGERSTWPRALLPWRETPGRIAVDLLKWREIGAGD
ncbi:MAG: hypothetical protein EA376_08390 [Phycisphaeraceae bacterium]|nr:MAG: hypothetical protein EA376_08390 [Phycisphaeraceae bacterium]